MSQYDNITTSPKSHHEPDSRFCFRTRGTYGGKPEIVEFASVAPYDVYDVDNPMCVAPYLGHTRRIDQSLSLTRQEPRHGVAYARFSAEL